MARAALAEGSRRAGGAEDRQAAAAAPLRGRRGRRPAARRSSRSPAPRHRAGGGGGEGAATGRARRRRRARPPLRHLIGCRGGRGPARSDWPARRGEGKEVGGKTPADWPRGGTGLGDWSPRVFSGSRLEAKGGGEEKNPSRGGGGRAGAPYGRSGSACAPLAPRGLCPGRAGPRLCLVTWGGRWLPAEREGRG